MERLAQDKNYYLIENNKDLSNLISKIEQSDIVTFDTETTGLNVRKDKVIGFSFSFGSGNGYYLPLYYYDRSSDNLIRLDIEPFLPYNNHAIALLTALSKKNLVMHNASFDTQVVYYNFGVDLLSALHYDTQDMIHSLMEEGPFGLKDFSIKYARELGLDSQDHANQEQLELQDSVLANGGKWLKTDKHIYKGDYKVIAKYACADTDLTYRIANWGTNKLKEEGLYDWFLSIEPTPLKKFVTIPMEFEGLYLDMPLLTSSISEIELEIAQAKTKVVSALLQTEEGKEYANSRLEKDYPIRNTGSFAQEVVTLFGLDLPKLDSGKYQINQKTLRSVLTPTSSESERRAISFLLDGAESLLPEEILAVRKRMLQSKEGSDSLINISSKQQMGEFVFQFLGIEPLSKTDKGAGQFNEDFIEHLAADYKFEWAKELRVYNKLVKLHGSSYARFYEEQENGVFYPYFKQHGTTSGRYSSNVQQLPRPLEDGSDDERIVRFTNRIRRLFIPKPGYVFIDDDYASLEPCVFAHDAGDQALLDIFIKGEDFYSKIAMMALGLTDVSADKKAPNFLKNIYPHHRQNAKAYALGIRYGAESGKVSQLLSISPEEAEVIVSKYFEAFPKLAGRMQDYKDQAKKYGAVKSEFGRVRHLPRVREIYKKFGDDILDYRKLGTLARKHYTSVNDLKEIRREYKNLLNNALNFPIQSAATSIINQASIAISMEFIEQGIDGWISAVIHDQIIATVRKDQKEKAAEIVQRHMETRNKIQVPLVAIPQFAYNMVEGH